MISQQKEAGRIVSQVQERLQSLYALDVDHRVGRFLIDRRDLRRYVKIPSDPYLPKELFLVRNQGKTGIDIALFFDQRVLANLEKNNPFVSLNGDNLSDFCVLIEGVSHFLYFLSKAACGLPLTLLEMELQAEIDKFLFLFLNYRSGREDPPYSLFLLETLFHRFSLRERMSTEEHNRYLTASRLASRYCYRLRQKYGLQAASRILMLKDVRHFYHFSHHQKIEWILH